MRITIQKFQELLSISNLDLDEFDKAVLLVQALTGKTEDDVNAMPTYKFNRYCAKINKAFNSFTGRMQEKKPRQYVWANGRLYHLSYDIKRAGAFVEIATFQQDVIGNLHKIMATMATPIGWNMRPKKREHSEIANDFLKADFSVAYHASVFFYAVFNEYLRITLPSLQQMTADQRSSLTSLPNILDGFIKASWYRKWRASH